MEDYRVLHDPKNKQFYIELESNYSKYLAKFRNVCAFHNGDRAVLDYDEKPNNTLDMYHTEVPVRYRGKGIAQRLAKTAFDYAVDNDYKIIPTCTYLKKFAAENNLPKYAIRLLSKW